VKNNGPSDKVQISISCRNLADVDTFSKSDPIVHVYIKDSHEKEFTFVGKTEGIDNNLNPDFTKTFIVDLYFEREQKMRFEVYDLDAGGSKTLIGECQSTLSKIMGSVR
jgi:copine 5/8/9